MSVLAYQVPQPPCPVDLRLDANEGRWAPETADVGTRVGRYPDDGPLRAALATRLGVDVAQVAVTAGGDDALDRLVRMGVRPGAEVVLPEPTFVMLRRYATEASATIRSIPWDAGPFPIDGVLEGLGEHTAMVFVVSPNNPTGAVARRTDLERVARAAPHALIVVDLAYAEYADEDLTRAALALPNAVVVRTFSKAWGLAGCRVGYAVGPADVIARLRALGPPYPTSAPSLALAEARLDRSENLARHVAVVRQERAQLAALLEECGIDALPSQANFVLARCSRAAFVHAALSGMGIAVRRFDGEDHVGLHDALRISCPGDAASFERLRHALLTVQRPQALLFDMDGVLADVRDSYRRAIAETARSFGVSVTDQDIAAAKNRGHANDDWALTRDLIQARGIDASLDEVRARFEALYQGDDGASGLWRSETLIPPLERLRAWARRLPLAVVTGRPRADAQRFLATFGLEDLFEAVVCREDAALKPSPEPVALAMERLGVQRAWMLGDTPDDVVAARAAATLAIGCIPPGVAQNGPLRAALHRAGAGIVLDSLDPLLDCLPEQLP